MQRGTSARITVPLFIAISFAVTACALRISETSTHKSTTSNVDNKLQDVGQHYVAIALGTGNQNIYNSETQAEIADSPVAVGLTPNTIIKHNISSSRVCLYIINQGAPEVHVLDFNPLTENVTNLGATAIGGFAGNARGLAVGGGQVFVSDGGGANIQAYAIDTDCSLIAGPVSNDGNGSIQHLTMTESGGFLFGNSTISNNIEIFSHDGVGGLTFLGDQAIAAGTPLNLEGSRSGSKLAVSNNVAMVELYEVGGGGWTLLDNQPISHSFSTDLEFSSGETKLFSANGRNVDIFDLSANTLVLHEVLNNVGNDGTCLGVAGVDVWVGDNSDTTLNNMVMDSNFMYSSGPTSIATIEDPGSNCVTTLYVPD